MAIGLDFILRANSAAFTRGLAQANNSIKDLKKGLREFDVGNGLKQALGIGGVIAGFRMAITNAQELRDEADKLGKSIDSGTRSVAELGDAIGGIATGFKNGLTTGLSFFTQIGDRARQFFQGVTQEQEDAARKMVETTGKAADEAQARLKKSREDNSPEKVAAAQARLDKSSRESMTQGTDDEKKLKDLIAEQFDLEKKLRSLPPKTTEAINVRAALVENEKQQKQAQANLDKDAKEKEDKRLEQAIKNQDEINEAQRKVKEEQAQKDKEIQDKFAPSVEQLANMSAGGFFDKNDPRIIAKKIKEREGFAAEAGGRGDIKNALKFGKEAQAMRESLAGKTGTGEALNAQTAEQAMKAALEQTNQELVAVKEQLQGLIKAQK